MDLINQTRELRSHLNRKEETITHLSEDVKDLAVLCFDPLHEYSLKSVQPVHVCCLFLCRFAWNHFVFVCFFIFQAKYNVACHEKDEIRDENQKLESQISDIKETMNRCITSNKIEVKNTALLDCRQREHLH